MSTPRMTEDELLSHRADVEVGDPEKCPGDWGAALQAKQHLGLIDDAIAYRRLLSKLGEMEGFDLVDDTRCGESWQDMGAPEIPDEPDWYRGEDIRDAIKGAS